MRLSPRILAGMALASFAVAAPLAAQARTHRAVNIEHRIDRGIRDGSLNRREAWRLRRQLLVAERMEYRARRGGLTRSEARRVRHRYDTLSNHVWRQRHDAQGRWKHR